MAGNCFLEMISILKAEQALQNLASNFHFSSIPPVRIEIVRFVLRVLFVLRHSIHEHLKHHKIDVRLNEDLELLNLDLNQFLTICFKLHIDNKVLLLKLLHGLQSFTWGELIDPLLDLEVIKVRICTDEVT